MFLAIVVLGLSTTASVALLVDPFRVFGTGRIPAEIVNERVAKPELFLQAQPAPQAVILGSSRVYKIDPKCVQELTGLPTFNFGVGNGNVDDWYAVLRFLQDRSRAPLRMMLIGVDVDAFDNHFDRRLAVAPYLRGYVGYSGVDWASVTRVLFGQDAFQYGLRSIYFYLRPNARGRDNYFGPDGYEYTPEPDEAIRKGTFSFTEATERQGKRVKRLAADPFDSLAPTRVQLFRIVARAAHAAGVRVVCFVTPLSPPLVKARALSQIPAREADVDALLRDLAREGVIEYHDAKEVADLGQDPEGFYDGAHMREATAAKLMLRIFHREHGCGQ